MNKLCFLLSSAECRVGLSYWHCSKAQAYNMRESKLNFFDFKAGHLTFSYLFQVIGLLQLYSKMQTSVCYIGMNLWACLCEIQCS